MVNNEIFIMKGSSLVKMKLQDVVFIEALDNQIVLNTTLGMFSIRLPMTVIEDHLPSKIFTRIHRSFIVNRTMIKGIDANSLDLFVGGTHKKLPIDQSFTDYLSFEKNVTAE